MLLPGSQKHIASVHHRQVLEQREVQRVKACKNAEKVPTPTVNNGESSGESGEKKPICFDVY